MLIKRFNSPRICYLAKKCFNGPCDIWNTYIEKCLIQPSEQRFFKPAIFDPSHLDRVSGFSEHTNLKDHLEIMQGGYRTIEATHGYKLQNVSIIDGFLYSSSAKYSLTADPERFFCKESKATETIDAGSLVSTYWGNRFFGDWIIDCLPLQELGTKYAQAIITGPHYTKSQEYLECLNGISTKRIERAQVSNLFIFDDFAHNTSKIKRLYNIRKKIASACSNIEKNNNVMFLRGQTGQPRILENEMEIADTLNKKGFDIVDPQNLTPKQIIEKSYGAQCIVSVDGSHMMYSLLSASEGCNVVSIQPPFRLSTWPKIFFENINANYALVFGIKKSHSSFYAHINEVEWAIDQAFNR